LGSNFGHIIRNDFRVGCSNMKPAQKKDGRIDTLYKRAINGKYTKEGKFLLSELIQDGVRIGVTKATAGRYADEVIKRLQKRGHLAN